MTPKIRSINNEDDGQGGGDVDEEEDMDKQEGRDDALNNGGMLVRRMGKRTQIIILNFIMEINMIITDTLFVSEELMSRFIIFFKIYLFQLAGYKRL